MDALSRPSTNSVLIGLLKRFKNPFSQSGQNSNKAIIFYRSGKGRFLVFKEKQVVFRKD